MCFQLHMIVGEMIVSGYMGILSVQKAELISSAYKVRL